MKFFLLTAILAAAAAGVAAEEKEVRLFQFYIISIFLYETNAPARPAVHMFYHIQSS